MAKKKFFDVWFVKANTVYKEVPFNVVTDWVQSARLVADDRIRPSGTAEWYKLGGFELLNVYMPPDEPGDDDVDLGELDTGFTWKRRPEEEDDDPDMIPLIDVSLVLLIFFMMTTTVAAVSNVLVPEMGNAAELTDESEAFWLGIDRDPVTGDPKYAISRGTAAPEQGDDGLTQQEVLAKFDERAANETVAVQIRIAAHREILGSYVRDLTAELEKRREKMRIGKIVAEVNENFE